MLLFAACAALVGHASPALAQWKAPQWGVTQAEVLSNSALQARKEKDRKDSRIRNARKLAEGPIVIDGIDFTASYYFGEKADRLVMINVVPALSDCPAAITSFQAAFGEGSREVKSTVIAENRPELVQEKIEWRGEGIAGSITYLGVSFGDQLAYCQLLHEE